MNEYNTENLISALEMLQFQPKTATPLPGVFSRVELHFSNGGTWEQLEEILQQVDGMADPMGPIGPLWIAVQLELGREVRAALEHTEVAKDVLHNLKTHGKMRFVEDAPAAN